MKIPPAKKVSNDVKACFKSTASLNPILHVTVLQSCICNRCLPKKRRERAAELQMAEK